MREEDKKICLQLAKQAIVSKFTKEKIVINEKLLPASLKNKQACFVTLTIDGNLRGCIGHILPIQLLWQDIIENAQAAAFQDPRFPPLTQDELKEIKIEISILDNPQKLSYSTISELLDYLKNNKPGVIIKQRERQATFLPQVWDELPNPEEFLTHLCLKAGLTPDAWQRELIIEIYKVEKIS